MQSIKSVTARMVCILALLGGPAVAEAESCNWALRSGTGPSARESPAMVYDSARNVCVLFGGNSNGGLQGDTWAWDGTTWIQRWPAAPSARYMHAMAYDSARGVTVLFGGFDAISRYKGDTWEYGTTNWTQRAPLMSPSARGGHAMAYDSARGMAVLFGGESSDYNAPPQYYGDTWVWVGTTWMPRMLATAPSARAGHAMAYDSARGVTVLFGGQDSSGNLGDTWEWDGTIWTQRTPATSPSARSYSAVAYDSARGVTVLFGGYRGDFMGDTWEWDGTNWTQRTPATTPSGRFGHAIAYDSARSMTVLFGGYAGGIMGDTWEYGPLVRIVQHPANCTIVSGCDAGFGVSAAASLGGTLSYQWRKDGAPIPGGSGPGKAFLRIPSAGRGDAGSYDCVVTGSGCEFVSVAATLTVKCRSDFDDDGDVDLADFGVFRACFNGPNRPPTESCP